MSRCCHRTVSICSVPKKKKKMVMGLTVIWLKEEKRGNMFCYYSILITNHSTTTEVRTNSRASMGRRRGRGQALGAGSELFRAFIIYNRPLVCWSSSSLYPSKITLCWRFLFIISQYHTLSALASRLDISGEFKQDFWMNFWHRLVAER